MRFGVGVTRLERLFAVNEAVRRAAPRPVSAARLAEQFDVSRRTIERDLASLRFAGAPLFSEPGRTGGQRSLERAENVVVTLSVAEVTALLVAIAAGGPDLPFADSAKTATARLLDGMPDATRVGVDELRSRVRTEVVASERPKIHIRRTLEEGVRRSVVVNLGYVDRHGVSTDRSVDCVGFLNSNDGWHLIGWCHLRQGGRLFRVDRIDAARLTRQAAASHDVDATLGWVPFDTDQP